MDNELTILCNQSTLFGHGCILAEAAHVLSKDPEVVLVAYDQLVDGGTGAVVVLDHGEPLLKGTDTQGELPPAPCTSQTSTARIIKLLGISPSLKRIELTIINNEMADNGSTAELTAEQ